MSQTTAAKAQPRLNIPEGPCWLVFFLPDTIFLALEIALPTFFRRNFDSSAEMDSYKSLENLDIRGLIMSIKPI